MSRAVGAKARYITPEVDKNVPLPVTTVRSKGMREPHPRIRWSFERLEVGDSLLAPEWCDAALAHKALSAARRKGLLPEGFESAVRLTDSRRIRVWRVA
jgi:hypothetical protein